MNKNMTLSLLFGVLMSIAALYLAFRNVQFSDLMDYLWSLQPLWLIPSPILVIMAFLLRAARWRVILLPAARVSYFQAYHPLVIGFMLPVEPA